MATLWWAWLCQALACVRTDASMLALTNGEASHGAVVSARSAGACSNGGRVWPGLRAEAWSHADDAPGLVVSKQA